MVGRKGCSDVGFEGLTHSQCRAGSGVVGDVCIGLPGDSLK